MTARNALAAWWNTELRLWALVLPNKMDSQATHATLQVRCTISFVCARYLYGCLMLVFCMICYCDQVNRS